MSETKYFQATAALLAKIDEINQRRNEIIDQHEAFVHRFGGQKPVYSSSRVVGASFEGAAPAGWSKPKWEGGIRYSRPLSSRKEGSAAYKEMNSLPRAPQWLDMLELVGLEGHCVMDSPPAGTIGFRMRYSSGHYVGEQLVIEVPGAEKYHGHELLREITKADFLQMQADHERTREA